jgi:hypothetical protein
MTSLARLYVSTTKKLEVYIVAPQILRSTTYLKRKKEAPKMDTQKVETQTLVNDMHKA